MSVLPRATDQNRFRTVSAQVVGPNPYRPAAGGNPRPTINLPCQEILSVNDVEMWADPDTGTGAVYIVRPVAVANGVVTYLVANPTPQLVHANHAHDLTFAAGKGGANPVNADTNQLGTGAGCVVAGAGADGGVVNTIDTAHAAVAGVELVVNAIDLSLVVVHARAYARVR